MLLAEDQPMRDNFAPEIKPYIRKEIMMTDERYV
jgi:hypothetical protein